MRGPCLAREIPAKVKAVTIRNVHTNIQRAASKQGRKQEGGDNKQGKGRGP